MKTKLIFGTEKQTTDDGAAVFAWWLTTTTPEGKSDNDEPIAGGFCASEADCINDAKIWFAMHPDYVAKVAL